MTAITENRAVTNPTAALTATQQNAVRCLASYKHQKRVGDTWWIGNFKFSASVLQKLAAHRLVIERRNTFGTHLKLTVAGELAAERLKRKAQ